MNNLDIKSLRNDFPILQQQVYGKPLVYFDNGATTQKPLSVIELEASLYKTVNANIHRGAHYLSQQCTKLYEEARETIQGFVNAKHSKEIIFTSGTTASINLIAFSFGEQFIHEGDEVIITEMEHHSNIVPWQMLCQRKKATLKVLPFNDSGELEMDKLDSLFSERTKLVSVTQLSNSLGTINPVKDIITRAHARNVPVLIDGAQGAQHLGIDVQELDCDFYVFSGHKIYGPTGIGVLYGKEKWLEQMPPWQGGGDMVNTVTFEHTTYAQLPFKFEAGTSNYIAAITLAEAIKYIQNIGTEKIHAYEHGLYEYASKQIGSIEGVTIYGTSKNHTSLVSFLIDGAHPYDTGMILDKLGIAVRTGTHCAEPVLQHYGIPGLVRASFALYNTCEEIDILCEGIRKTQTLFS